MARSKHSRGRFHYNKEATIPRRLSVKKWKTKCRRLMQKGRYSDLPPMKGTEGWITR